MTKPTADPVKRHSRYNMNFWRELVEKPREVLVSIRTGYGNVVACTKHLQGETVLVVHPMSVTCPLCRALENGCEVERKRNHFFVAWQTARTLMPKLTEKLIEAKVLLPLDMVNSLFWLTEYVKKEVP